MHIVLLEIIVSQKYNDSRSDFTLRLIKDNSVKQFQY